METSVMKSVDVTITLGYNQLNLIAQGTQYYERIGSTIRIHRVIYTVYASTQSSSTADYIRVSLFYDKFGYTIIGPSSTLQPFVSQDYDGTLNTTSAYNLPTPINPDRYIYICTDRGPVSTNPPFVLTRDIPVDLRTVYTKSDTALGLISTGTLYLGVTTNGVTPPTVGGTCRIYYTDT